MFKKFLSIILAVSLLLSMAFAVSVNAADEWAIDLSGYNDGDMFTKDGRNYKTIVVLEDNIKSALFSSAGTTYGTDTLTNSVNLTVTNGLTSDTKGVVISTTMKITNASTRVYLNVIHPELGKGGQFYLDLSGGQIKTTPSSSTSVNTGLTYSANSWIKLNFALNYTTGYYEIGVTDVATGVTNTATGTQTELIRTTAEELAAITRFQWYTGCNTYISEFSAYAVEDATAIAPSHTLVRDDFDADTTALTGWNGGGTVATTDRGKSAMIDCSAAKAVNKAIKLASDAKGLVSEFSVKLTSKTAGNFFYACNSSYATANYRLIQFTNGGAIHAFNNTMPLGTYETNVWYDIRIENNFVNDFTRVSIFDGANERVYEGIRENTSWDTISNINNVYFYTEQAEGKSIYIDDVNIFYLTENEVSGLKNPRTYSIHNEFENFTEGDMQDDLLEDIGCGAPTSFSLISAASEDAFEVGIESITNSGRGKSFKASLLNPEIPSGQSRGFYKDFSAIQNGVAEFDMLLSEQSGVMVIETQMSNSGNGNMAYSTPLRFKADGKVYDGTGADEKGSWEAGKWYHVKLTAGTYTIDEAEVGGIKAEVYNESGVKVAENTVNSSADLNTRDSIRNVKFTMGEAANTIYVDNFKAYAETGAQGLFPTPSYLLRNKSVAPDGAITLAFSKFVNLTNSKFKVNGEVVTATLLGGNVVSLNKALEEGETYEIEYTAADTDGYTTSGYVGNITVPRALIIENYTAATVESPSASVKVTINSVNTAKKVQLIVAAYNEAETRLLDIDVKTADANEGEQTLTATVETAGATKLKTFLWDGASLTPIETE